MPQLAASHTTVPKLYEYSVQNGLGVPASKPPSCTSSASTECCRSYSCLALR
ncbi:MAG: hypothetical protein BWY91_02782 [bacterium ADurb.BinA028]|nr:MAG: hypothetical protein BWY91_02782 [bacterium ADurb.BinA028]